VNLIKQRQQQISAFDHVSIASIPADAVTASGSGLDPDISPANAAIQVDRVAAARHLPVSEVRARVTPPVPALRRWGRGLRGVRSLRGFRSLRNIRSLRGFPVRSFPVRSFPV